MLNFRKICRVILAAALICTFAGSAMAQSSYLPDKYMKDAKEEACKESCKDGVCEFVSPTGEWVCKQKETETQKAEDQAKTVGAGTNTGQSASAVTGCSSNYGLFSGLIETGRKIFAGLRDLIYVVAGFGIIGVAVGGFFGNLNWKWLGAIVIALVVIATTGEIINMITGCDQYTAQMITDTLK